MNFKSVIFSAIIVWSIGIIGYVASYFVPVMADPDLQANWAVSLVLIPAALIGAHIYYRKGYKTNGFKLGVAMFGVAFFLDILITVPFFVMPYGGNYTTFFSDIGFWLIAIEYVSVVAAYWQIEKAVIVSKSHKDI